MLEVEDAVDLLQVLQREARRGQSHQGRAAARFGVEDDVALLGFAGHGDELLRADDAILIGQGMAGQGHGAAPEVDMVALLALTWPSARQSPRMSSSAWAWRCAALPAPMI